jgi:hypothetical protein
MPDRRAVPSAYRPDTCFASSPCMATALSRARVPASPQARYGLLADFLEPIAAAFAGESNAFALSYTCR